MKGAAIINAVPNMTIIINSTMSIEPIIPNIKPAIIPNTTVIHSKTSLTVKLLYNVFVRSIKLSVHGCLISIMCIYVY